MAVHKWRRRPTKHFGEVWVPFGQVQFRHIDGHFFTLALQIDSGAVVSLLRRSVADLLGLTFGDGRAIELTNVGGGATRARVHEITTRFADGIELSVPYAIAENETVPNLLGRLGVFDRLQLDFDPSLNVTTISSPWLNASQRLLWEGLGETSEHVVARWNNVEMAGPARSVVPKFINRAGQVYASAVAMLKAHSTYAGPALIRAMFELAIQFEYLMDDPGPRAKAYSDFAWITKHKQSQAIVKNPEGQISRAIANSTKRPEGEARIRREFDRVRPQFARPNGGMWNNWYRMNVSELADSIGRDGEYRLVYASCSAWAHGDPFSTSHIQSHAFARPESVFMYCSAYYARMLLKLADVGKIILTSEQSELLSGFSQRMD